MDPAIELNKAATAARRSVGYKTAVSALQELLASKRLTPVYEIILVGGSTHAPVYRCRVTITGLLNPPFSTWSTGNTKKATKQDAAKAALDEIVLASELLRVRSIAPAEDRHQPDSTTQENLSEEERAMKNAVGTLQELCISLKWPFPDYELERESGPPHEKQFTIVCSLQGSTQLGQGSSKKFAKQQAAYRMWKLLKFPSNDPMEYSNQWYYNEENDEMTEEDPAGYSRILEDTEEDPAGYWNHGNESESIINQDVMSIDEGTENAEGTTDAVSTTSGCANPDDEGSSDTDNDHDSMSGNCTDTDADVEMSDESCDGNDTEIISESEKELDANSDNDETPDPMNRADGPSGFSPLGQPQNGEMDNLRDCEKFLRTISTSHHVQLTFVDEKPTKVKCFVELSSLPVVICRGYGKTRGEAHANAAYKAREYLETVLRNSAL